MRERGAVADVQVLAHELPEVVAMQDYLPAADEPMGDFGDFGGSGWVDQGSDEEEEEETEVEVAARKVRVEYRDFRTRRDRTDTTNKNWAEQTEDMVDAYMDWCLRQTSGEPLPECDKLPLWVDVVDVFGKCSVDLYRALLIILYRYGVQRNPPDDGQVRLRQLDPLRNPTYVAFETFDRVHHSHYQPLSQVIRPLTQAGGSTICQDSM